MNAAKFQTIYDDYVQDIARKQKVDRAEAEIVTRFTNFMREGFGIDANVFVQEQTIRMAQIEARGRIDLLFGGLVLEFKKKLTTRSDPSQLEEYVRGLADEGKEYTGIFTDGLWFKIYSLTEDDYEMIDEFKLNELRPEVARVRLDAYVFSQHSQPPTADDIVYRFGNTSPTFRRAAQELRQLLEKVNDSPMLDTWRAQWKRLLSRVYGSDVGSDELFIRHTYLSQFARLLAYAALHGLPNDTERVSAIIKGDAFQASGVRNIGEADFFSWVLMDDIRQDALQLFERLAQTFVVYDLNRIDQDLLKQLYQNLVDAKDRHDLGEYYTPDWLAELTLNDIGYTMGKSLYDPTCGSGSFLFSAIKHLEKQGVSGQDLVEFVTNNVMGTDIHPLAVIISRINYLLALSSHLRAKREGGSTDLVNIPVYMANALLLPLQDEDAKGLVVRVSDDLRARSFMLPDETAQDTGLLTDVVDLMENIARMSTFDATRYQDAIREEHTKHGISASDLTLTHWTQNLRLLKDLIDSDRNGIWAFILKNVARPLAFARHGFDYVVGNPPWLSYRYIKNKDYQRDVVTLYKYYGLIESSQRNLVTQMDLSSLFYELVRDRYLAEGGKVAFVMPRSVITGAKQHRAFQRKGISRAIDLRDVEPLFNVPTAVLVYEGSVAGDILPLTQYSGKLPAHELDWITAEPHLTHAPSQLKFVEDGVRSPELKQKFSTGASLFPRNLCFVVPEGNPNSPAIITDPEVDKDAKPPYKGLKLRGIVQDPYLYSTLLSKFMVPFGFGRLQTVALPFRLEEEKLVLVNAEDFIYAGHSESGEWFSKVSSKRDELKKENDQLSFVERIDYHRDLSEQKPLHSYKVLYNASGSNITCAVLSPSDADMVVNGRKTQGFIVDYKTYYYDAPTLEVAHYLCAVLNADSVNQAIKPYQSQGLMGYRDVTSTPFEACGIPEFDADDADHQALVQLSREAHEEVALLKQSGELDGWVNTIRDRARNATQGQLDKIDAIVKRIVEM